MKITLLMVFATLLAFLFVCLVQAVLKHSKPTIQTASAKRYRVRFKKLNLIERLALPFQSAMQWLFRPRVFYGPSRLVACNIAEGTHKEAITKLPDAAITTRHLLYKVGSDANHIAVNAAANTVPIGTVDDECAAAELAAGNHYLTVGLLGKGSTKRMVASEAIDAGELVYTAANGKVQDEPAGATVYLVGVALTTVTTDGDIIEVSDCAPVKCVFA